jgi:pseudaminic acid synthase
MRSKIRIRNIEIGRGLKPMIVAEMSGNHNQSLDKALEIVDEVAKTGANALKIQTYTADTLTIDKKDGDFFLGDKSSLWHGMSMYELYEKAHTPWDWHKPIFDRCKELGLICFSSPFDETAVDFLEDLDCPCYKIGSTENTDLNLLKKVAKTKKPLIISTGMATVSELGEMIRVVRKSGCSDIIFLKCTAAYPAKPSDANLNTIKNMRDMLDCHIGLSDHTLGTAVAIASVALGSVMIEKHFTLSREDGGVDSKFSMEPGEFKQMVVDAENAWSALGRIYYGPTSNENSNLSRRSLYVVKDMKKGDTVNKDNVRSIRPGYGLNVKYLDVIQGMKVLKDVPIGTRFSFDLVK